MISKRKTISLHVFLALVSIIVTIYARADESIKVTDGSLPEIMIAGTVEVSPREKLTLYDLVEIRGGNERLIAELKNRTILNEDSKVQRSTMLRALKGIRARFILPESVKLIFSKQSVSRLELERKIKSQLLSRCQTCEYQIYIQNVPRSISANWSLELNVDLNKETSMIPIRDESLEQGQGNWVIAEIKKYAEIPVLTRHVAVNTSIDSSMYKMERRILRSTTDFLTSEKDLEGVQAARNLNAGQTISSRDIKKETVVRKNQIVKAQVDRNEFEVSITAIAEDSGAIGDTIRVRNIDSQKIFAAVVMAKGVVRIE